ncbi:hypothetical protein QFZ37_003920 [Chryseobacterium ginsenosidimutans]|nr:hypothetical protein [Chryseobacterium ginsenosidimutans]
MNGDEEKFYAFPDFYHLFEFIFQSYFIVDKI